MKTPHPLSCSGSILFQFRIPVAGVFFILAAAMGVLGAGKGGGNSFSGGIAPYNASADSFNAGADTDTSSVIVQLKGDPVSTNSATKPARGKKIDFNSNTVKSYRAQLAAERNDFKNWLQ